MTTKAEAKNIIIDAVAKAGGCRGRDLVGLHALELFEVEGGIGPLLAELVADKYLVEVAYVIDNAWWSFYLPRNTLVVLRGTL